MSAAPAAEAAGDAARVEPADAGIAVGMMTLFPASTRAHATYNPRGAGGRDADGKVKPKYETIRMAVTPELWAQHLNGRYPLVLGLACDDGTAQVACVDVDDYTVNVTALVDRIKALGLPLYVRRSKSEGAHILAFFDAPVPVDEAREVGRGMARRLGLDDSDTPGAVEIFPKPQNPDPEKLPKGLNMPYLGESYGIVEPGSKVCGVMTVERFLRTVERLTAEQRAELASARTPRKSRPTRTSGDADEGGAEYAAARLRALTAELAELAPGSRNDTLNKHAFCMGTMIGRGWIERADVEQEFQAAIATWDDRAKTMDTLRRALGDGERKPHGDLDTRPVVRVRAGGLDATATRGEEVLRDAGVQLFQRGGTLVRPVIDEVEAAHGRRTKVAQFVRVDATYLRDQLSRVARWEKYDGRSRRCVPTDPPTETASTILARVGEWGFPVVAGIITTPTMRPDGSLLTQPGYDLATRLLLVEPSPMPVIPDAPTREDALAALERLEMLLAEFPLIDEVARAVALSALITPVVRGAFPVAPMHALLAPVAGSGKSYLLDTVSAIAIGQVMPVMAAGRDEEETEKRLGAALLTGQPLISIDNVSGELRGDALCQMIERPVVEVRILGRSERVRIEARGTSLFCTGNNMVLVGDLCRRTLTATLDPQLERPELREFTGNPVADVLADRGAYVAAALTVCRAYVAAGRPSRAKRLASFEGWSDTVRSALIWLGRADPVDSMEVARAEDPELGALREMLSAWAEVIGVGWTYRRTLQDVIDVSNEKTSGDSDAPRWPALAAAAQGAVGGHRPADAASLGLWARARKSRVVGDLRLANKPNAKGSSTWWVEHSDGGQREGLRASAGEPASGARPTGTTGDLSLIKLAVWTSRETADAVLVQTTVGGPEVWLPKSQITIVEREDGATEVTVPSWLAKKKGLGVAGGAQADIPF